MYLFNDVIYCDNILKNNKIFYLSPVNQLLKEGLRQQKIFFAFHDKWPSYAKKAVNILFESAVENLTCVMLLGEEEAILPLSQLYYSGTIYDIYNGLKKLDKRIVRIAW
ncbi:MAG: hypothetical protein LN560_01195 [Rickettsia endosymbiont of Sceptobius lativentris]|nr:hypothetical protein [Rickettsia endosymbiont of Sceptobius lativentris]